jgi:mannose-6-phosphate isomerase-like protein (cupin superfamily)
MNIVNTFQKGTTLNILRDTSLPPNHLDHWQAEVISTGTGPIFSVPLHWHKRHAERMTIIEGRVKATLDGVTTILNAGESIYIEPYVVHGFEGFPGEKVVARERADPAGEYKAA